MADIKKKKCLDDEDLANINGGVDKDCGLVLAPKTLSSSTGNSFYKFWGILFPQIRRPWRNSEDQQTYNKGKMRL